MNKDIYRFLFFFYRANFVVINGIHYSGHVARQFSVCWDDTGVGRCRSHDTRKDMVGVSGEYDRFVEFPVRRAFSVR